MKGGLEADQAVWRQAQEDIDRVAHKTIHALDNLHSCGKNELEFALAVAAAVGAVGAIPFTLGASVAVSAVGAAAAVGSAVDKAADVDVGGATPERIVHSMKTSIDRLTEEIRGQQARIADALQHYAGEVDHHKANEKSPFVTPRPNLASLEGQDLTGRKGLGTYD